MGIGLNGQALWLAKALPQEFSDRTSCTTRSIGRSTAGRGCFSNLYAIPRLQRLQLFEHPFRFRLLFNRTLAQIAVSFRERLLAQIIQSEEHASRGPG